MRWWQAGSLPGWRVLLLFNLSIQCVLVTFLVFGVSFPIGWCIDLVALALQLFMWGRCIPAFVGVRDLPARRTQWLGAVPWPEMPRVTHVTVTRTFDPEDGSEVWVVEEDE